VLVLRDRREDPQRRQRLLVVDHAEDLAELVALVHVGVVGVLVLRQRRRGRLRVAPRRRLRIRRRLRHFRRRVAQQLRPEQGVRLALALADPQHGPHVAALAVLLEEHLVDDAAGQRRHRRRLRRRRRAAPELPPRPPGQPLGLPALADGLLELGLVEEQRRLRVLLHLDEDERVPLVVGRVVVAQQLEEVVGLAVRDVRALLDLPPQHGGGRVVVAQLLELRLRLLGGRRRRVPLVQEHLQERVADVHRAAPVVVA
jgi:hypothetical protein